ncbi:hypothetical protein [Geminisphaera colitermitum]|uniref:hypothetical protein n=1 Tax=Geminisphaera colitermitum TaxID=1148786 RepID=UPI000158D62B|nr:hypothetical protein [Geminisphaera colitermitum]
MNSYTKLLYFLCLLVTLSGVSHALADEFDDILGADTPQVAIAVEEDEIATPEKSWVPPPPLVLPPVLLPALKPAIAPVLQNLPLPPHLTPLQFEHLRVTLTGVLQRETVLTSTGLVILTPPVLVDPLTSLESWLRIFRAAEVTELPSYAHGTPAWVQWRQLSANPLTTEADWIRFYRILSSSV